MQVSRANSWVPVRRKALLSGLTALALANCSDPNKPSAESPSPELTTSRGRPIRLSHSRQSTAVGLNDQGAVVGQNLILDNGGERFTAFLWKPGGGTELPGLSLISCCHAAFAVNESGEAAGFSYTDQGIPRPVVWSSVGEVRDLGTLPDQIAGLAYDINESGVIVGFGGDFSSQSKPIVWIPGLDPQELATLTAEGTGAVQAINDGGESVGWSADPSGVSHAVMWTSAGAIVELGHGTAWGINNDGVVVGQGTRGAFRWTASEGMVFLDSLAGGSSVAYDINDLGVIVGSFTFTSGEGRQLTRPFRWTETEGMLELGTPAPHPGQVFAIAINTCGEAAGYGVVNRATLAILWRGKCGDS